MNDPNKVPLIERQCLCGCGRIFRCMPSSQSVYWSQGCKEKITPKVSRNSKQCKQERAREAILRKKQDGIRQGWQGEGAGGGTTVTTDISSDSPSL